MVTKPSPTPPPSTCFWWQTSPAPPCFLDIEFFEEGFAVAIDGFGAEVHNRVLCRWVLSSRGGWIQFLFSLRWLDLVTFEVFHQRFGYLFVFGESQTAWYRQTLFEDLRFDIFERVTLDFCAASGWRWGLHLPWKRPGPISKWAVSQVMVSRPSVPAFWHRVRQHPGLAKATILEAVDELFCRCARWNSLRSLQNGWSMLPMPDKRGCDRRW